MSKSNSRQSISIKRYKNGGVYLKPSEKDMLSRYDFGGLLQGLLGGVSSVASSTVGKTNPLLGAAMGIGSQGLMGLLSNNQSQQQQPQQQSVQRPTPQQQQYAPTFPDGGKVSNVDNTKVPTNYYTPGTPWVDKYVDVINNAKNINDPKLYQDPSQLQGIYNIVKTSTGTGNNNIYTQKLLDNYNKLYGNQGVMYESDTIKAPNTLKAIREFDPRFKQLKTQYDKEGNKSIDVKGRALGGGAFGVGNQQYANGGLFKPTGSRTNYSIKYPIGGMSQPNAELEQGEPFKTPDGQIGQVSNNAPTHQQGGVPMNLPENTQILGKMVDPEFNKQYKELGARLKKAQDKYNAILKDKPTPLAKKTAKLMLDRIQQEFNNLMSKQESQKGQGQQLEPQMFPYGGMPLMENGKVSMQYPDGGLTPLKGTSQYDYGWTNPNGQPNYTTKQPQQFNTVDYNNVPMPNVEEQPNYNTDIAPINYQNQQSSNQPFSSNESSQKGGFKDILGTLGSISPIGYNLAKGVFGKPQRLTSGDYMNPYSGQIKSIMANRNYNIDPELEANREATAQYYNNLRQAAPSQSRYLAGLQTGQISRERADAEAMSRKQNINNQYRAEQASTLGNLGQQEANIKFGVQDINTRAQAAQNSYLPTALSQLSQLSQGTKRMAGQEKLDAQKLAIFKEMFKNYSVNDLVNIFNK